MLLNKEVAGTFSHSPSTFTNYCACFKVF